MEALWERHGLSPREKEVLAIWLSGHTSSYVEENLHISKNTVKTHLSHIYAKTGTSNREELLTLLESSE
jgi:DNA-binding CsgD family transcriptional regulator